MELGRAEVLRRADGQFVACGTLLAECDVAARQFETAGTGRGGDQCPIRQADRSADDGPCGGGIAFPADGGVGTVVGGFGSAVLESLNDAGGRGRIISGDWECRTGMCYTRNEANSWPKRDGRAGAGEAVELSERTGVRAMAGT